MFTRKTRLILVTLTGAVLAMGCGSGYGSNAGSDGYGATGPTPPPASNTVDATPSLTFTPGTLNVSVGQDVAFAFGSVPHNVFFTPQAGAPADITGNNVNVSISRTFTTAGTYAYTCHIHPGMQGSVVVQ